VVKSVRTKYNDETYHLIFDGIFNSIGLIVNSAVNAIDQMAQNPQQELQQISVLQVSIHYIIYFILIVVFKINFFFY
jgi:hypothetical protein